MTQEMLTQTVAEALADVKLPQSTKAELAALATMPEVLEAAKVVGRWIWVTFPSKPSQECRAYLKAHKYRYNPQRGAWQNACGFFTRRAPYDPRVKYGQIAASTYVPVPDKD